MSQSWDNMASMHDHVFIITVYAHKHNQSVPCACADGSGCRGHTPPTKCAMATFSLCSNVVTGLLTGMTKNRLCMPLASLEAPWIAPAPAQQAGQVDLAETDKNENERGNENEKGNGRQEGYKCGIRPRPCKFMIMRDSVVHPETYHRLKTGCSFELYNILGQHTQKFACPESGRTFLVFAFRHR